jgi:acyl-CoA reductase-like NAD-dependent aldehyde dehydrogenase
MDPAVDEFTRVTHQLFVGAQWVDAASGETFDTPNPATGEKLASVAAAVTRAMPVGDPLDPATVVGPVITKAAQERILGMIERARGERAGKLFFGGGIPGGKLSKGFFVEPTVFGDVDPASEIGQVEVFGPVLCLMRLRTED